MDHKCNVDRPRWFKPANGNGIVVSGCGLKATFKLKAIGSGKITFALKGMDLRFDGTRFPLYSDYTSVKIDGIEKLAQPVATWHDSPHRIQIDVKDGESHLIQLIYRSHRYPKAELYRALKALRVCASADRLLPDYRIRPYWDSNSRRKICDTWPFLLDKLRGGWRCLKENGLNYTIKHAFGKCLRRLGCKVKW